MMQMDRFHAKRNICSWWTATGQAGQLSVTTTSLIAAMLLQRNSKENNHGNLLSELIKNSDLSHLCSGWLKLPGLNELFPAIDFALAKGAKIIIYSNRGRKGTQTADDVLEALASRSGLTHIVVDNVKRPLHTKLYYFEAAQKYTAVIGSANITEGGLTGNEELSVVFSGTAGDPLHQQLQEYLQELSSINPPKTAGR